MNAVFTDSDASPRPDSELGTFSKEFNAFETEHALFEELVDADGFAWWDLVRYTVQFAICTERGILGRRQVADSSVLTRARRAAQRVAILARTQLALATFSPRASQAPHGGDLFVYSRLTPVFDRALNDVGEASVRIGLSTPGPGQASNGLTKKGLEALTALRARFATCPPDVSREASWLDGLLKGAFESQLDFASIISAKYRAHLVDRAIWGRILSRMPPGGTLHFINDDTTRTLTTMARARGLLTREYQHAYMGVNHFAYNHPPQARGIPTLPDEVLVHRDTGDIVVPTTLVPVKAPGLAAVRGPRDIDVLVGGSPVNNDEAQLIVAALAGRGRSVAIKLHPAQTAASSGMRSRFPADQLTIIEGCEDFTLIAARSRIYVPANPTSTTSFEAAELGARLVVVDFGGRKMTNAIDKLVAARVDNLSALPGLVDRLLEED